MPTLAFSYLGRALGAPLASAWRWWTSELRGMLSPLAFSRSGRRARSYVRLRPGQIELDIINGDAAERYVEARSLDEADEDSWEQLAQLTQGTRLTVVLGSPDAFWTDVSLPKAAARRLRSAIALQLARVAPLDTNLLVWSFVRTDASDASLMARVGMARADRVASISDAFTLRGFDRPAIVLDADGHLIKIADGRGPSIRAVFLGSEAHPRVVALALLASIPLTTLAGASLLQSAVEARTQVLGSEIAPRLAADREARAHQRLRRVLQPLLGRPTASTSLEMLAETLPSSTAVKSLGQGPNGHLLLIVETADGELTHAAVAASPAVLRASLVDLVPAGSDRFIATIDVVLR